MTKNNSKKKWYLVYVPELKKEVRVAIRHSALISADTVHAIVDAVEDSF